MSIKFTTVRIVSSLIVVTGILFSIAFWQTDAFTQLGITLTTNPGLERGLIGHWTFDADDTHTVITDRSGSSADGNLILGASGNTATTTRPGVLGQAMEFDGTNDYVSVPTGVAPAPSTTMTISAWVYLPDASATGGLVSRHVSATENYQMVITGNRLQTSIETGGTDTDRLVTDTTVLKNNTWHHIVVVREDASTMNTYVDTVAQPQSNGAMGENDTSGAMIIGARKVGTNYLNGRVDDVRVYSRALSTTEIDRLYGLGATTKVGKTLTTNVTLETGLVGHWSFDGDTLASVVADETSNGNDGNLILGASGNTATTTRPGVVGQALDLDGTDDEVDLGDVLDMGTSDWTAGAWVKVTAPASISGIIAKADTSSDSGRWSLRLGTDGKVTASIDYGPSATAVSSSVVTDGAWHHVLGVWDRDGNMQVYIDGVADGSATSISASNGVDLDIGIDLSLGYYGGFGYLPGQIDDARVYNRALTQAEITRLYGLGATTKVGKTLTTNVTLETGLIGHWTFDGSDMHTVVADASGNGKDLNLINYSATTTRPGAIGQALELDQGSSHYATISGSTLAGHGTGAFSAGGWVYVNPGSLSSFNNAYGTAIIRSVDNEEEGDFWLGVNNSGGIKFANFREASPDTDGIQNAGGASSITEGEWRHVFATWDGTTNRIYVDGVELSILSTSSTAGGWAGSGIDIGRTYTSGSSYYWDGYLDDIRVYNRALSATEIDRLYGLGATTKVGKTLATNVTLENGLVGHWSFDGPTMYTNVADSSDEGNNGNLIHGGSGTSTKPGPIGQTLEFDGTDDYINASGTTYNNNAVTFSVWYKMDTKATGSNLRTLVGDFVFGDSAGFSLFADDQGHTSLAIAGFFTSAGYTIYQGAGVGSSTVGEWTHAVMTYDGSDLKLYQNGSQVWNQVIEDTIVTNSADFFIGRANGGNYFDGNIDDARVYNRALSATEITRLYNLGR